MLKLSKTNELVLDFSASNMDDTAMKLQILKCGFELWPKIISVHPWFQVNIVKKFLQAFLRYQVHNNWINIKPPTTAGRIKKLKILCIVFMCVYFLTLSLKFSKICLSRKGLQRSEAFRNAWIQSSQNLLLTGGENIFIRLLNLHRHKILCTISTHQVYITRNAAGLTSVWECGWAGGAVYDQVRVCVLWDGLTQRCCSSVLLGQALQTGSFDEPDSE